MKNYKKEFVVTWEEKAHYFRIKVFSKEDDVIGIISYWPSFEKKYMYFCAKRNDVEFNYADSLGECFEKLYYESIGLFNISLIEKALNKKEGF